MVWACQGLSTTYIMKSLILILSLTHNWLNDKSGFFFFGKINNSIKISSCFIMSMKNLRGQW